MTYVRTIVLCWVLGQPPGILTHFLVFYEPYFFNNLLALSKSVVRLHEHSIYQYLRLQVTVVQEGKKPLTRCDLCGMCMASGGDHKTSDDNTVRQEHTYVVAEEGCRDIKPMRGGNFHYHGVIQGRVHRGHGGVQLFGEVYGPVGQVLVGGPPEYQESLGLFRQVAMYRGDGAFCFSKFLLGSSAGSVTIWGGYLAIVGGN